MSIGGNIKKLRLQHGLDQAQLGKIAGVTDKAVSTWENNISIPRMGAIEKIANYFGILKSDIIEDRIESKSLDEISFAAFDGFKKLDPANQKMILNIINDINSRNK